MTVATAMSDEMVLATVRATVKMAAQFRRMTTQQRVECLPVVGRQRMMDGRGWQRRPQHFRQLWARVIMPPHFAATERHGQGASVNLLDGHCAALDFSIELATFASYGAPGEISIYLGFAKRDAFSLWQYR